MTISILVSEGTSDDTTYQEAIQLAGKILLAKGYIKPGFTEACIKRESDFPTGLEVNPGIGIAIPHGSSSFVNNSCISFVRLINPVPFGRMEDASKKINCRFLFNLALKDGNAHLKTLRNLMKLFQNDEFLKKISELNLSKLPCYLQGKILSK